MRFLSSLNYELILTPHKLKPNLFEIRDPNDYPVLYSAIIGSIDIFLTGDKDFKNISIEKTRNTLPRQILFLNICQIYSDFYFQINFPIPSTKYHTYMESLKKLWQEVFSCNKTHS